MEILKVFAKIYERQKWGDKGGKKKPRSKEINTDQCFENIQCIQCTQMLISTLEEAVQTCSWL